MRDIKEREGQLKKRLIELDSRLHRIDEHLHVGAEELRLVHGLRCARAAKAGRAVRREHDEWGR